MKSESGFSFAMASQPFYLILVLLSFVTDVVFYCVVMLNLTHSGERSDPRHRHLSRHPESNHRWQDGTR